MTKGHELRLHIMKALPSTAWEDLKTEPLREGNKAYQRGGNVVPTGCPLKIGAPTKHRKRQGALLHEFIEGILEYLRQHSQMVHHRGNDSNRRPESNRRNRICFKERDLSGGR